MSTFAIGDVQGCYEELVQLLDLVKFNPGPDKVWFTGDLVNRGPLSLKVLRLVRELDDRAITVLGNHDLHLLAIAFGVARLTADDTFVDILRAKDCDTLLAWLRERPLLHTEPEMDFALLHAGLPPQWDMYTARECADEIQTMLRGPGCRDFLNNMYGDLPHTWSESLTGWQRLRFSSNCFTRLRYCDADGRLMLNAKGPRGTQPDGFMPWYEIDNRKSNGSRIVFGHWSTVGMTADEMGRFGAYGLDTGCLWGGVLTAMRLEDQCLFSVPSRQVVSIKRQSRGAGQR